MKKALSAAVLCLACGQSAAYCFEAAAARYGLPSRILVAVSKVENAQGDPYMVRRNKDGSADYGLMQINTVWLPALAGYGIDSVEKLLDPCVNVMVGAWILSMNIAKKGWTWEAIGQYHSKTPSRRDGYANRVRLMLAKIEAGSWTK